MLVKEFYRIDSKEVQEDGSVVYGVSLNTTHDVYKGHFPERPITPGVCNIQMIKELAEDASGRSLTLSEIDRCRLTAMVTPDGSPDLTVKIKISENFALNAEIFHDATTFMTLSGKLVTDF
jgi:3-hydroxyacyl-[acyl-carrier-protein] dehydratase